MRISKILFPFLTLGVSAAIGSYYVLGNQQNEGKRDIVKATGENSVQSSKITQSADDKKNIKWKLLFSCKEKKINGNSYFFYSGSLLTYENYKEKEKDYIAKKEKAKNWNYTEKRDFDISKDIYKEKVEAYLKKENDKLDSLESQLTLQAIKPLQKYIKDNEKEFKEIFGDDVYENVLAWQWI